MGYIYTLLYLVWLCALWMHLNHGIWSAMQTMGLSNKTWFHRLKTISSLQAKLQSAKVESQPNDEMSSGWLLIHIAM